MLVENFPGFSSVELAPASWSVYAHTIRWLNTLPLLLCVTQPQFRPAGGTQWI